ncbi:ATP-dependent sacrificial sulfur transferase LarE [Desulfogranum mediterraneum]|uniref:ATP-dependent sacrificial sulfur transferase LarE n=1 Tax=Desulfogranum mediterraneum TaxID=160661 RepID=UPI000404EF76|nr:ATP-dependent sacrificial sulfur transferase LarE [Desulfogranum mediterraneum]
MQLHEKIEQLRSALLGYGRVAVAFSGGVDSSLLVKCALDTLGAGNVLLLFGHSALLTAQEVERAGNWLRDNGYPLGVEMEVVELQPLSWKEFVANREDRCYVCKLRIYKTFREVMERKNFSILIDGTNSDDLKSHRPGLRAIHELGVKTPFVDAGLDKADIREQSRQLGLSSWELPSASCLATRIPHGLELTAGRIGKIAAWEQGVAHFGFQECRVGMDRDGKDVVYLQLAQADLAKLANPDLRIALLRFFNSQGIKKVYLDLAGR